jgi:hypothetical protein
LAKGNDGNLLQHAVECAMAEHLLHLTGQLHIVLTHSMSPYEEFEQPRHAAHGLIDRALQMAQQPQASDEPPVVNAYRKTEADETQYPNSAELMAALAEPRQLSGTLVELDRHKFQLLRARWGEAGVQLIHNSWRIPLRHGHLSCPIAIDRPWLFSMDPMTFVSAGRQDDDCLHELDLHRLFATVEGYLRSGQRGAILIFCYSLRRNLHRVEF